MISIDLIKTPIHRYTFKNKRIKQWVESECEEPVLNLFAGKITLDVHEIRNDIDTTMVADHHLDALDFLKQWEGPKFRTILLDPPYSYRKSMELYKGNRASRFRQVKDLIPTCLEPDGKVITFGYQSVSLGTGRGFVLESVTIFHHGGAIHDTIACVERYSPIHQKNKCRK